MAVAAVTTVFADIGACTCAFLAAWLFRLATSAATGSWFPIRERRRRRLEADLRVRSRCRACGAVGAVRFIDPRADVGDVVRATSRFMARVTRSS